MTLTATAKQIVKARRERDGIELVKHGSQDAYLGCSNVSVSNGVLFAGDCGFGKIYPTTDEVWGVVATGTLVISYLEIFPQ